MPLETRRRLCTIRGVIAGTPIMEESQVVDLKVLDETDDELEEFDGIANLQENCINNPELADWCQDWDNSGWDDDDVDDEFVNRIMKELEAYKANTTIN